MRRFLVLAVAGLFLAGGWRAAGLAHEVTDPELIARFERLSRNGNSTCSLAFREAIPSLPDGARLQGSCCSPMNLERYGAQVVALRDYAAIPIIPPDPYDIDGALAKRLDAAYDLTLTKAEEAQYQWATTVADEGGPCCCPCWRWRVYGGLAKLLIQEHGFDGQQVATVWDLSDGCGGAEHDHGAS